jgi:phospholipid-binding lipoprotein MlaA
MTRPFLAVVALLFAVLASGCASTNAPKADPLEGLNRATFKLNDVIDNAILTPVAKGYQFVTPQPVRTGVSNVFSNVGDVGTAANNLLQGKAANALSDAGRVLINSTLGVLGIFDVATPMGLEKHDEDFGQTLGKWGVPAGPYLVLPLFGPSTVRDAVGRVPDRYAGYSRYLEHVPTRNVTTAIEIVNLRANLLSTTSTLDEAALDKYQFVRDGYLQRRLNQVYDGKVPQEKRDKLEEDLEPGGPATPTPAPAPAATKDKPDK